ncbi:MAG: hypothetical protein R2719_15500 [Micropruina sp.]
MLYGILASALVGVYALLAAFVVRLFPARRPGRGRAVALLALPLRDWLQRLIDRRVYGQSGSPYELLTALARGVGRALTPGDMLTEVVERVAEGLRVPYVAVLLEPGDQPERSAGTRRPWPVASLELVHRGATIGHLVVQQRAPDEPWLPRERRLLKALALQIAAPAAAVRLIRDLQHTRERLSHDARGGTPPAAPGPARRRRSGAERRPDASCVRSRRPWTPTSGRYGRWRTISAWPRTNCGARSTVCGHRPSTGDWCRR